MLRHDPANIIHLQQALQTLWLRNFLFVYYAYYFINNYNKNVRQIYIVKRIFGFAAKQEQDGEPMSKLLKLGYIFTFS